MTQLLGFAPLVFLGITNLKGKEKNIVSQKLLERISQYIVIRIIELLSEKDLENIDDDPKKLFSIAEQKIPNFDNKVKLFLEDFKKEFNANTQQL